MFELLTIAVLGDAQGAPEAVRSVYSRLEDCETVDGPAPVNERCEGVAGWDIFIGASDHSAGVAYSDRARAEQLAQQPLTGGHFQTVSPVVEWRMRFDGGVWAPFATIHRWTTAEMIIDAQTGAAPGETRELGNILVVTALRPDGAIGACHAAYVDARAVYDANTVARAAADLNADSVQCGYDAPVRIGAGEAVRVMERAGLPY